MAFIDRVLQQPSYGWCNLKGELITPSPRQLYQEVFSRVNLFTTRKNWISAISWLMAIYLLPFMALAFFKHFSWSLLGIGLVCLANRAVHIMFKEACLIICCRMSTSKHSQGINPS